jgi:hypothetical protein
MFRPVLGAVGLCLALLLLPSSNAFAGAEQGTVDWIGVWRPGPAKWVLRNANKGSATIDEQIYIKPSTDLPVTAEWVKGEGDVMAVFRPSLTKFFWRSVNFGPADVGSQAFGDSEDLPISGNWLSGGPAAGDGYGTYRPSARRFFFADALITPGVTSQAYGSDGDLPVVGDWSGSGTDSIGVFRPTAARYYLRSVKTGMSDTSTMAFGDPTDLPIVGDWDGDGTDTIGSFRPATATTSPVFFMTNTNLRADTFSQSFGQTNGSDVPVIGHWQGLPPQ